MMRKNQYKDTKSSFLIKLSSDWSETWEKTQTTNIRNESEDFITDAIDIKRLIIKYCKQQYVHIFNSVDEIDQFLKGYKLRLFIREEIDWIGNIECSSIYLRQVNLTLKTFPQRKLQTQMSLMVKSSKYLWKK